MKSIFLLFLLSLSTLFGSSAKEVFPTVLNSQSTIELQKPILVQETDFLQSATLINEENCLLKNTKHKKNENKKHKKDKKKHHDKEVLCKHNSNSITTLPPFKFFPTNNQETLELNKKRKTFKQSHVPSLVITNSKTELIFKAPKNSNGKRVQHIGTITDTAHTSSYTFHEGDYYIESLDIQSDDPKKNDIFKLKTKGKVRIFLNSESKIIKRAEKYKKRGYIELNYKNKSSDHLVLFAKSNLTIDASRRFKVKGFIYGYEDITLIGNKNATLHGAVTAEGALTVGKDEAQHHKQERGGEYIYAQASVKKLNLTFENESLLDTTPPVITLNGDANITLTEGDVYEELGATATDDVDGDVSVSISGSVDTSALGTYRVTYTAQDSVGNSVTLERTVNVVLLPDTVVPILTLNGESEITLFQSVAYTELGATATDVRDGDVNVTIVGEVDSSTIGIYTITYTARDKAGNESSITRTVNVILPPDVTPPVITLNGESTVTLFQGTSYVELGATATDDRDTNVSIIISGNVDSATLGSYTITYTARDSAGNTTTIERTVNVVLPPDTKAPVITLNGDANITLTQGESYEELGASATDERDGDVNVTIEGNVDTSIVGTYTITYTATDKAGNEATVTRTVTVVAPTLTDLSLESNVTTLNVGEKAELIVMATYSDGSTSEIDANVEYIIAPTDSVELNGTVLTAKKDSNVTVQAKVGTIFSNTLNLTIAWVVNGHVLPPEPDKTLNDSTLLGVDVNDNGVRDDVERWIYINYKENHPVYIDIAMQGAKTKQIMLKDPTKAKKIHNIMVAPILCESYYKVCIDSPIIKDGKRINSKFFRKIIFNTKERMDAYLQYDDLLSGDSYTVPWCSERKQLCDFNTSKYEE